MDLFAPTLNQMIFLFTFIAIGYLLVRFGIVPHGSAGLLGKLENWVFIPALVLRTFIQNFTVKNLGVTWKLLVFSLIVIAVVIPITLLLCRFLSHDTYIRKIYIYSLSFSNFSFMGNAIVQALFPDIFYEYIIFTLVLWTLIYIWGVPELLVSDGEKKSIAKRLRSFINPMFICMIVGMIFGLTGLSIPSAFGKVIDLSADCMSPIAMILTGFAVAEINLKKTFSKKRVYGISAIRLLAYPLLGIGAFVLLNQFISIPDSYIICAICTLAMPTGLNTIVIPAAYGRDTSVASGLALVSHILSIISIPLMFMLLKMIL